MTISSRSAGVWPSTLATASPTHGAPSRTAISTETAARGRWSSAAFGLAPCRQRQHRREVAHPGHPPERRSSPKRRRGSATRPARAGDPVALELHVREAACRHRARSSPRVRKSWVAQLRSSRQNARARYSVTYFFASRRTAGRLWCGSTRNSRPPGRTTRPSAREHLVARWKWWRLWITKAESIDAGRTCAGRSSAVRRTTCDVGEPLAPARARPDTARMIRHRLDRHHADRRGGRSAS